MTEGGFRVEGESLRHPDTFAAVQAALGELASQFQLRVSPLTPEIEDAPQPNSWEHDIRGLNKEDFYRLLQLPESRFSKPAITRAYQVSMRKARNNRGLIEEFYDSRFVPRELVEGLVKNFDPKVSDEFHPVNLGIKSISVLRALLDHTRPAEPPTE